MAPEIMTEFIIVGMNVTPDEITQAIGIAPTKTWRFGEPDQNTFARRKHKDNGGCISTSYHQDVDLEKYARQLLEVLLPKSELITTFCRENGLACELSFAAYVTEETPTTVLSKELIKDLAKWNASLDLDIILTEDNSKQEVS